MLFLALFKLYLAREIKGAAIGIIVEVMIRQTTCQIIEKK